MAARRIGTSWWVDFQVTRTRYRKRSPLNTKGGAQTYEVFLRGELAKHGSLAHLEKQAATPKTVTFAEFAERWMCDYVAVHNKYSEQYTKASKLRSQILPAFGALTLPEITAVRVEQFKAVKLREGLSPKSVNNYLTILRKCLRTAVEWGELGAVPVFRPLRVAPTAFRVLPQEDERRLLAAAPSGSWEHAMVLLALRSGLRYSELGALQWGDVALGVERVAVCVRRAVVRRRFDSPKSNRIRHVPLTRDAADALRALPRVGELVFMADGRGISHQRAAEALARLCARAEIERVTWHVFRHTFASRLVMAGAHLQAVQQLLGHSTIEMTLRYAHLSPGFLRDAVDRLEPDLAAGRQLSAGDPVSTEVTRAA